MRTRIDNVHSFVTAVMAAAIYDCEEDAPMVTGNQLIERLKLDSFRVSPRKGDAAWAREIYHATRRLYETETND